MVLSLVFERSAHVSEPLILVFERFVHVFEPLVLVYEPLVLVCEPLARVCVAFARMYERLVRVYVPLGRVCVPFTHAGLPQGGWDVADAHSGAFGTPALAGRRHGMGARMPVGRWLCCPPRRPPCTAPKDLSGKAPWVPIGNLPPYIRNRDRLAYSLRQIKGELEIGDWRFQIGDRGIGDRGIGDRGIGDRGIGDRGIGDRGIGDRGIGDRGIGDRRIVECGMRSA